MILHLYSQYCPHAAAWLVGTRQGLLAVRTAIDTALARGPTADIAVDMFAADGEGYTVHVTMEASAETLAHAYVPPYTAAEYLTHERQWPKREQIIRVVEETRQHP